MLMIHKHEIRYKLVKELTWKFLWTQVTGGSLRMPLAGGFFGSLAVFSGGDYVSASFFAAWASFSSISASSLSRKIKNSWASYRRNSNMIAYANR